MSTETDTINEHFTLCEAAPDLLAILDELVNRSPLRWPLTQSEWDSNPPVIIAKARAAIAKAKGDK